MAAASFSRDEDVVREITANLELPVATVARCFNCDVPAVPVAPASLQMINLFEPRDPRLRTLQTYRIEIEPASPDVRWWAVASMMDLQTRHVTLYQPSF